MATFDHAKKAYNHVLKAAAIANVPVLPSNDGRTLPPGGSGGGTPRQTPWYAIEEDFGPLGPGTRWFAGDVFSGGKSANPFPSRLADEGSPSSLGGTTGAGVGIIASTTGTASYAAHLTPATGFVSIAPPTLSSPPVPVGPLVPSVSRPANSECLLAADDARSRILKPTGCPVPALEHIVSGEGGGIYSSDGGLDLLGSIVDGN